MQKFHAFHAILKHITVFTASCLLFRGPMNSVHALTVHVTKSHFNITLQSTTYSSKGLFTCGFPHQNPVRISFLSDMCHTSQASPLPWFDHPSSLTYGDEYNSLRASLNNFRQPPVRFYFLVLHTFFSIASEKQLVSQRYLHYWKVFQPCNRCAFGTWYTFKDMYLISET